MNIPAKDVARCIRAGSERFIEKLESVNTRNYEKGKQEGKLEHDLIANARTMVAEFAVAILTERTWNGSFVYSNRFHEHREHLPDVGTNIEVRTIRTRDSVFIKEDDIGKVIFCCEVIDEDKFSRVKIHGYVEAEKAMLPEYVDTYNDGWRYPMDLLTLPTPPAWLEVGLIDYE